MPLEKLLEWLGALPDPLRGALAQLSLVAALAVPLQIAFPAVRRKSKLTTVEGWDDLFYWFQPALLGFTIYASLSTGAIRFVTERSEPLFPSLATWPFWAQVVVAVWAFDFVVYWRHRFMHVIPFLWPIHAVHHTARQIDFFTTKRLHFLELWLGSVLTGLVVWRFGLALAPLAVGYQIYISFNFFIHTNVRVRFSGPLKYVLVSPFMHRWHHALDAKAINRNFGVVFAWNDWLFGTALHPEHEPDAYGLDVPAQESARESILAHVLYPLKVALVRLRPAPPSVSESGPAE